MTKREEIEIALNEIEDIKAKLGNLIKEGVIDLLNKYGGKIYFNDKEGFIDCFDGLTIAYDGGNHPEYASNCFSTVEGAYLENGVIYLVTEDSDAYGWDRIWSIDEKENIYNALVYFDNFEEE